MVKYALADHWTALKRTRSVKLISLIGSGLSIFEWTIGFLRGHTLNLQDAQHVLKKLPGQPLVWVLSTLSLTLGALVVAIFYESKKIIQAHLEAHEGEVKTLSVRHEDALSMVEAEHGKCEVLQGKTEAQGVEVRNLKAKQADLEKRLADEVAKAGRPHVTLSFVDVDYSRSRNQSPVPDEKQTELLATCSGRDAYGVYIDRTQIGSIVLQSRYPAEKIPAGESMLLPYTLLHYSERHCQEAINLEFRGHLRGLLDKVMKDTGQPVNISFRIQYTDVDSTPWNTVMDLFYIGGVGPHFYIVKPKQSAQSTTDAD